MNLLVNAMIAKSDFRRKGICHKMNLQVEGHGSYGKCPPPSRKFSRGLQRRMYMEYTMLNNGIKMPLLGFGVYMMTDPKEC